MGATSRSSGPDTGLGDTLARATRATGLDRVAETVARALGKTDCGCGERRELLNRLFPYRQTPAPAPLEAGETTPEARNAAAPPAPPTPLTVLAAYLNDPLSVRRVYDWARGVYPDCPVASGPLLVCRFLFLAGLAVPYGMFPDRQIRLLQQSGWQYLSPAEPPQPGDVFLLSDGSQVAGIGLVAATGPESGTFLAVDERVGTTGASRRQSIAPDADCLGVVAWLRLG